MHERGRNDPRNDLIIIILAFCTKTSNLDFRTIDRYTLIEQSVNIGKQVS